VRLRLCWVLVLAALAAGALAPSTAHAVDPSGPVCDKWADGCDAPWYCLINDRLPSNCEPSDIPDALFYKPWVKWTTIGLGGLALVTLLASLFPGLKVSDEDSREIRSGFSEYRLASATAHVERVDRHTHFEAWDETIYNPYGGWSRRSGSRMHAVTLATVTNAQGTARIVIPNIPVVPGQQLFHLWALERDGDKLARRGPSVLFRIDTTGAVFPLDGQLKKLVQFSRLPLLPLTIAQGITLHWFAIASAPLVALVYVILGAPFTASRLGRLKRHIYANVLPRRVRAT